MKNNLLMMLSFLVMTFSSCKKNEPVAPEENPDPLGINWVLVEGGTFEMGDTLKGSFPDEKPLHSVTLADFYIAKYEVTNSQFAEFLNTYKSDTVKTGKYAGKTIVFKSKWGLIKVDSLWKPVAGYENYPVINVAWCGAEEFCKYYGFRLPTEAEWEYAAKGGNKSNNYLYSGSDSLNDVAWCSPLAEDAPGVHSHPVGEKRPNELGIYDMSGNAWEWCYDLYGKYSGNDEINPQGPSSGTNRVFRGGCWLSMSVNCTNTVRGGGSSDFHGITHNGFRCAKTK